MSKNLFILFFFFSLFTTAQELPPVVNYGPNQYAAGNQNWMVSQAGSENFYFANSTGLLEYNGENWNIYPVPNKTIVRSVKVVGDRIYTGAYMEAGYWERDKFGNLQYTSLSTDFSDLISDGEQFWDIEFLDGMVAFRSFGGIYFYDPEKGSVSKMDNPLGRPISAMFLLNKELYFQLVGKGLYRIKNGVPQLVIPFEDFQEVAIMHLYTKEDNLCFVSGNSEFFKWDGKKLIKFNQSLSLEIGYPNILSALNLSDGSVILGTVGSGILQINPEGKLVNTFNQENVLFNNTVLDLYSDDSGHIWAGLDYGISMIDLHSQFGSFQDNKGEIGSVYSSYEEDGKLYLGTNQGLYLRNKGEGSFSLIEGTKGQVWFIAKVGGHIFCGHDTGTFLIEGDKARKISNRLGTWMVKEYEEGVFIQGHYNGISFLREKESGIKELPMLQEFPHSSKFIEIDENRNVWVSNEHKGVFRMKLDDSLSLPPVQIKNYKFPNESGITSSIFRFHDTLYYSSKQNIYQYDEKTDNFDRDNRLNEIITSIDRISGKMISESQGSKIWGFASEGIFYLEPAQLNEDYTWDFIYIDQYFRNIAIGYENIAGIGDDEYVLGVSNGYVKFHLPLEEWEINKIRLHQVSVNRLDNPAENVEIAKAGSFDYKYNNISFQYSVPVYEKYLKAVYSYRLLGFSPNWSEWEANPVASFKNLDFGDYTFEVRAKIGDTVSETLTYDFRIERPYYLSNLAIALYVLLLMLIIFSVHFLYKRHHKKVAAENERALKLKNLEAEREIIKLKNEKLEQDMANKNRELAVSTMSLIKKNEFLTSIKKKLKDSEESPKVKSVIKTIDKDISEEDNWKFFKKAFSNADKDFFKKIKAQHPDLTANDLKLCAYLRLNLSSKEIAPLLNISVKSVEIKRYRLRKKMNLDRDTNLTDYILAL
ncbi:helix-turn-helix and ligand-binding sensor domain-containing protein [Christiangramia crocea]|uniref:LuxR C-terminal-related transcriptional regulator n=1 Tax=Christiangramia crocea TaxID=2904124 RepID=A0A9X1UUH4_9FLAO|nr:triple tyrosine motif-containing protein [Gramella crocea]MCG9970557.1 LuxR C-terminal-related transcriptional regulator [Gramella crocea]